MKAFITDLIKACSGGKIAVKDLDEKGDEMGGWIGGRDKHAVVHLQRCRGFYLNKERNAFVNNLLLLHLVP